MESLMSLAPESPFFGGYLLVVREGWEMMMVEISKSRGSKVFACPDELESWSKESSRDESKSRRDQIQAFARLFQSEIDSFSTLSLQVES